MIKKTLKINGVERILILDKDETLAQVLRDHLLLTGCNDLDTVSTVSSDVRLAAVKVTVEPVMLL